MPNSTIQSSPRATPLGHLNFEALRREWRTAQAAAIGAQRDDEDEKIMRVLDAEIAIERAPSATAAEHILKLRVMIRLASVAYGDGDIDWSEAECLLECLDREMVGDHAMSQAQAKDSHMIMTPHESSPYPLGYLISSSETVLDTLNQLPLGHPNYRHLMAQSIELDRQILDTPARDLRNLVARAELLTQLLDSTQICEDVKAQAHVCLVRVEALHLGAENFGSQQSSMEGPHDLIEQVELLRQLLTANGASKYISALADAFLADTETLEN
jgi:hypothetical protein